MNYIAQFILIALITGVAFWMAHNVAHGRKPWNGYEA